MLLTALGLVMPIAIAVACILAVSQMREPERQRLNATIVAGAGAAYLNGGFGGWEFAYTTAATFVAYQGLRSYRFIGLAWAMHTGWDVLHHLYGTPIIAFAPSSSAGCAICDTVLAAWFFGGAPSLQEVRGRMARR
jgi:hypothetical protein